MGDPGGRDDTTILVVEDEPSFVEALTIGLGREGFRVEVATDGIEALERFAEVAPDLVLLDVMLPRLSGIDVCRRLRATSQVPIIMVTAKGAEIDTVVGLEVGADDYVTKPYRLRELVARIRAVLRRRSGGEGGEGAGGAEVGVAGGGGAAAPGVSAGATAGAPAGGSSPQDGRYVAGDVTIDVSRHEVVVRGEPVAMPLKEFDLLTMLMAAAGRVLTRDTLIDRVWGMDYVGDTKTLDVHVKRLRAKVEIDPANPERIVTIRGVGYKFVPVG